MKKVERNKYRKKVNANHKAFAFYLYNCPEEPVSEFVNALDDCEFNEKWRRVLESEEEYYHYHPDHLGSSSWITDQRGTPVQHIQYLPFGETWADQRNANWNAPYTFSGKEKDWETSYHYYGARYYDSDLSIWLSVDPMADKLPHQSPYVYCNNNPIILVDPDGRFPFKMHKEMVCSALSRSCLSPVSKRQMLAGTSTTADIKYASIGMVHLDNMKGGYSSIATAYNNAKNNFVNNMNQGNYEDAGVNLHTVADFYSHSNYIPLYNQYAKENNLSMDVNDIPTFSDAMNNPDLSKFLEDNGLSTGSYGDGILAYPKDKFFGKEGSHGKMNLDSNNSPAGKQLYNGKNTMHEAAKAAAQKELNKLVKEN